MTASHLFTGVALAALLMAGAVQGAPLLAHKPDEPAYAFRIKLAAQ